MLSPKVARCRIALCSHDAQGLGHVRRNLAIARAMARLVPRPDVLILSGATEAGALPRPEGCDFIGLPSMVKAGPGEYAARHLSMPVHEAVGVLHASPRGEDPGCDGARYEVEDECRAALRWVAPALRWGLLPEPGTGEIDAALAPLRLGQPGPVALLHRDLHDKQLVDLGG